MAGSGNGSKPQREDKPALIVETAARLFDTAGYSNTSMDAIAREVGLAKPTLYHYFRGKSDILIEIHETFIDPLIESQVTRLAQDATPKEQLVGAMTDILSLMEHRRGHVRVFFEHHRELPSASKRSLVRRRARYQEMMADIFRDGTRAGEFREVDPESAALAVFGMCNWAYQWWTPGKGLSPEVEAKRFASMLIDGIGVPAGVQAK
jgi:TetR/AcrR family transcriptional regulator, cholesterol catabolism regulator